MFFSGLVVCSVANALLLVQMGHDEPSAAVEVLAPKTAEPVAAEVAAV